MAVFTIKKSANGEGQGVFAARDIEQGEIIIEERPLISFDMNDKRLLKGRVPPARIYAAWEGLKDEDKKWFKTLTYPEDDQELLQYAKDALKPGNKDVGRVVARYNNNCFLAGDVEVLNKDICRINHSCEKNATFAGNANKFVVLAMRNIEAGEEILISYIRLMDTRSGRRQSLRAYGFDCNCKACNLPPKDSAQRDVRMKSLSALDRALPTVLGAGSAGFLPPEITNKCTEMLSILQGEPTLLDEMCIKQELLAILYHKEKRHEDAVKEVQKAYDNARICYGDGQTVTERCKNELLTFHEYNG